MPRKKRIIGDSLTGSWRRVTFITPDTFLRPIKIISTTFSIVENKGETAIAEVDTLNYFSVDLRELDYRVIKEHESEEEALKFHEKLCRGGLLLYED